MIKINNYVFQLNYNYEEDWDGKVDEDEKDFKIDKNNLNVQKNMLEKMLNL